MKSFSSQSFDANVLNIDLNLRTSNESRGSKDQKLEDPPEAAPHASTCKPRFADQRHAKAICIGFALMLSLFIQFGGTHAHSTNAAAKVLDDPGVQAINIPSYARAIHTK